MLVSLLLVCWAKKGRTEPPIWFQLRSSSRKLVVANKKSPILAAALLLSLLRLMSSDVRFGANWWQWSLITIIHRYNRWHLFGSTRTCTFEFVCVPLPRLQESCSHDLTIHSLTAWQCAKTWLASANLLMLLLHYLWFDCHWHQQRGQAQPFLQMGVTLHLQCSALCCWLDVLSFSESRWKLLE